MAFALQSWAPPISGISLDYTPQQQVVGDPMNDVRLNRQNASLMNWIRNKIKPSPIVLGSGLPNGPDDQIGRRRGGTGVGAIPGVGGVPGAGAVPSAMMAATPAVPGTTMMGMPAPPVAGGGLPGGPPLGGLPYMVAPEDYEASPIPSDYMGYQGAQVAAAELAKSKARQAAYFGTDKPLPVRTTPVVRGPLAVPRGKK